MHNARFMRTDVGGEFSELLLFPEVRQSFEALKWLEVD
jgi:hypothetical protein